MKYGTSPSAGSSVPSLRDVSLLMDKWPRLPAIRSITARLHDCFVRVRSTHCRGSESWERVARSNFDLNQELNSACACMLEGRGRFEEREWILNPISTGSAVGNSTSEWVLPCIAFRTARSSLNVRIHNLDRPSSNGAAGGSSNAGPLPYGRGSEGGRSAQICPKGCQ